MMSSDKNKGFSLRVPRPPVLMLYQYARLMCEACRDTYHTVILEHDDVMKRRSHAGKDANDGDCAGIC